MAWITDVLGALDNLLRNLAPPINKKPAPKFPAPDGTVPPWLQVMRDITGTLEEPGADDNPTILSWADFIGRQYPEMKEYAAQYVHDAIPWCGLTVAYCMAHAGVRPVFGASDIDKFLWAAAWGRWGRQLDKPVLGCVMVFTRNGGGHVTLFEREENGYYVCRGGNQGDAVKLSQYPPSKFTCAVWPTP